MLGISLGIDSGMGAEGIFSSPLEAFSACSCGGMGSAASCKVFSVL